MKLTVNNLTKTFKHESILENISFELTSPKIYGLLGRNGVGKSTLLNCICDRLLFKQGKVLLNEKTIHNNNEQLKQIYLMNDNSETYYGWETVSDLYKYTDIAYGDFNYKNAHELANKFGIEERQKFKHLSTGLQTAVKLILAFCVNAKIIFLDEPTLGLDAYLRDVFYQELIKTYNENPRIFVLSTHLINEVQNLIEDVIILNNKKIVLNKTSVENTCQLVTQLQGKREDIKNLLGEKFSSYDAITVGKQIIINVKTELLQKKNIPTTITKHPVDLQTAFITLTKKGNK